MKKQTATLLSKRNKKLEEGDQRKTIDSLLKEIQTLQKKLDFKETFKIEHSKITASSSNGTSESTAFALLSDVHYEEIVEKETVLGFNEYNLDIAKKRLHEYFFRVVKMIKKEQAQTEINTLCLAILGDLISNYIHDILMEVNQLPPSDALMAVMGEISTGIKYILKNSDVKIDVVCMCGNHSRQGKELHIAKETGNSLEYIAYNFLAQSFKREKRVKFFIPKSYLFYYKVYDFTVAFHHGHFVRYNGGVGGLTIPMNKAIAQWDKLQHADLYCCGHFHQMTDGGNFLVNGCVIGYNSYALSIKAAYEPAKQVFFLVNKKYNCKTVVSPILFSN